MNRLCIFLAITFLFALPSRSQTKNATDSLSLELQEIVIKAQQPATRLEGSSLVTSVAGSKLQNLGNALDVLAQLPLINVNDGSVSITGRRNPEIFIDGRPMRDNEELSQLLSGNIKRIELLMAPGAMYDSTTDAVIKITTKRNFSQGISLSDRSEVKRGRKWSIMNSADINYRTGVWDYFLSGSMNHSNSLTKGMSLNYLEYNGESTTTGSSQRNSSLTDALTVKTGLNYSHGELSTGAYYRLNPGQTDFNGSGNEWLDSDQPLFRNISRNISARSHRMSAYYDNTFAEKYRLHFDGDFLHSSTGSSVATSYPTSEIASVNSSDHRSSNLYAGKLYADFPLAKGTLTTGTQASHTRTSLDYRMLNPEVESYIPSSLTDARQISVAVFTSWSRKSGNMSLTAGARYEYADYDFFVNNRRDCDMSRRDHMITPDISLNYTFNDLCGLSLNYKAATVKPPYSQLTGSLIYSGVHQIEGGNPALKDGRKHEVKLFGTCGNFMMQAGFTRDIDTYAFVKQIYPASTLQLLLHPVNINLSSVNFYLIWDKTIGPWTPDVTAGVYKQWLNIAGQAYDRPIFAYYFDNTISFPNGWLCTANLQGQTKGDMHTNRFASTAFTFNASIGKTLLNNSLTIKLSATDIFNSACNDWTMRTFGIFMDKRQSYDQRCVSLSIIYRFQPRKSGYKGEAASESELNRL